MQTVTRRRGRPKGVKAPEASPGIQALDRALDVLEALAGRDGITLSELAAHLGQSTATMHRVLGALEQRRYVESSAKSQEWFVGPEAFRLGCAFLRRTNLVERSRSVMRDLMMRTGETSNLGIERNGEVLFVSQVESSETIRAFFPPGARAPLHASGIGKALLGAFDDERLDGFLRRARLARFTDKTIVGADALRQAAHAIRRQGYALDDEERTVGMRCIAASILDGYGEAVAGISISGPTPRLPDERVREFGAEVARAACEVSRRLGAA